MINCPICNFPTIFLIQKKDRFGQEYDYVKCKNCRFLFDKDLVQNNNKLEGKASKVYNQDYFENIDSGWKMRGDHFSGVVNILLKLYALIKNKKNIKVLDYGGGNGYVTSKINHNFETLYYDKYEKPSYGGNYKVLEKPIAVNIIFAVELVEHLTDINEWDFLKDLSPDIFIFTTGLSNNINDEELLNWDYLNSDAGHTALYSYKSLYLLAKKYGFFYFFFPNISCHIFLKSKWLSKVNFVRIEYFFYSILRMIKNVLGRIGYALGAVKRYLFKDTRYFFLYLLRYFHNNHRNHAKFYTDEELADLIKQGKSIIRLGDGEIGFTHFLSIWFQSYSDSLRNDLLKIIRTYNNQKSYILGIVPFINYTNTELKKINRFHVFRQQKVTYELIFNKQETYFDSLVFYKEGRFEHIVLPYIKTKKVIIATNEGNIEKIRNSKLSSTDYIYISCGVVNTYEDRLRIKKEIIDVIDSTSLLKSDFAVLMSVGLAKTIIYDMADLGYQVLDIGRGLENYYIGIKSIEHTI